MDIYEITELIMTYHFASYLVVILTCGFVSSRIAKMLDFGMNPYHLLWFVKRGLAELLTKQTILERHDLTYDQNYEQMSDRYEQSSRHSFILRLINCVFCLTVWISVLVTILLLVLTQLHCSLLAIIPIVAFYMTEKL